MDKVFSQLKALKKIKFPPDDVIFKDYENEPNTKMIKVKIENGNVYTLRGKRRGKAFFVFNFLKDIANYDKSINIIMYINYSDNDRNNEIDIINTGNNNYDNNFSCGVNELNNDVVKIINSKKIVTEYPIFTFTKDIDSNNLLLPGHDILNVNENFEDKNFEDKKDNIIFRASNIVADISLPARILIAQYGFLNNNIIDSKFGFKSGNILQNYTKNQLRDLCSHNHLQISGNRSVLLDRLLENNISLEQNNHLGFKTHVCHKTFLKVYQKLNIINKNVDINKFYDYFHVNNWSNDWPKNYKYLYINHSMKHINLFQLNSILIRYYNDKYPDLITYHDLFLKDKYNSFHVKLEDLENFKSNLHKINTKKIINNCHNTFNKYLKYTNLVKTYSTFLKEYQNLCN
jgi:hypothetical protein